MVANENPKLDTSLNKYLDESILDELEKEGFFKRITGKVIRVPNGSKSFQAFKRQVF